MEERHPIPQNVTGFQFKLIGEMTVRQFAYLAGNLLTAYLMYVLPFPSLIKWPLVLFFALLGVALAFIPFQGRPLDRWLVNFFKAVFSPSQYVYQVKVTAQIKSSPPPPPVQKTAFPPILEKAKQTQEKSAGPPTIDASSKIISVDIAGVPPAAEQPATLPKPIVQVPEAQPVVENIVRPLPTNGPAMPAKKPQTKEEILLAQKGLETELSKLVTRRVEIQSDMKRLQEAARKAQRMETTAFRVRSLPQDVAPVAGIPTIPQAPNFISGIVKNSRGEILPDILIEVKDENGNLMRAFKTSKLGRFTAATALDNGKYFIELEDPKGQYKFDRIGLALTGTIVLPLEISNLNEREELRRKLFS